LTVYEHLDGLLSIGHGPHTLGTYDVEGRLLTPASQSVGQAAWGVCCLGGAELVDPGVPGAVMCPVGSLDVPGFHSGGRAPRMGSVPPCWERRQGPINNRTDHLLQQLDILTCYEHATSRGLTGRDSSRCAAYGFKDRLLISR